MKTLIKTIATGLLATFITFITFFYFFPPQCLFSQGELSDDDDEIEEVEQRPLGLLAPDEVPLAPGHFRWTQLSFDPTLV